MEIELNSEGLQKSSKALYFLIGVFFACSFLFLLHHSLFLKNLYVYIDELRYLHLNDSIFNQGRILIQAAPDNFQKVLYPIVLWPASFFVGTLYYTYIISIVNVFLMSTMVPISFFLAKTCKLNPLNTIIVLIMAVITPDLMYSMTFMSENLYLPLGTFIIALTWKFIDTDANQHKQKYHSIILGSLIFLLYLNKEVGIVFIGGYLAVLVYIWIDEGNKSKKNRLLLKNILLSCAVFIGLYCITKLTIFSGMNNVYSGQLIPKPGALSEWIVYFFRVYGVNLTWLLIAYGFFPVILPLYLWKRLSHTTKRSYVFIIAILLLTLALTAYTISLHEDFPNLAPRQHLRYLCPLFIPFMVLFLKTTEPLGILEYIREKILVISVFLFFASLFFLKIPFELGCRVDHTMLSYILYFQAHPRLLKVTIFFTVSTLSFLIYKKLVYVPYVICFIITIMSLGNRSLITKVFHNDYKAEQRYVSETLKLKHDINRLSGNILFLNSDLPNGKIAQRYLDTYLPNRLNITSIKVLEERLKQKKTQDYIELNLLIPGLNEVSYFLTDPQSDIYLDKKEVTFLKKYSLNLSLYKNNNPAFLSSLRPQIIFGERKMNS